MARARRDRARLCRRHAAPDHAPDLPDARRAEVQRQDGAEGDQRGRARHHRRLRRRQPRRDGGVEPAPVAASTPRLTTSPAAPRCISSRRRTPITKSSSTARRSPAKASATTSSRSTARPTCRGNSRSASRCRRRTTSTCSRRISASSPSSARTTTIEGWNVSVGGGMGMTHGEPDTYPRIADVLGFCRPEDVMTVAEAVVTVQRDWGDRTNRKHARLKYTIDDRGARRLPRRGREARRQAARAGAALRVHLDRRPLWLDRRRGRQRPSDAVRRERPRCATCRTAAAAHRLRRIAEMHDGEFRITPNQNLIIANVADGQAGRDRGARRRAWPDGARSRRCGAIRWPASRCRPAASRSPRASAICRT